MQTDQLSGLILYEPWISAGKSLYTPGQLERLDALLASGDREGVVTTMFADIVGVTPHEMELLASSPSWSDRIAAAHTIPREARAEDSYRLPADQAYKLSIPVLLLRGGDSPPPGWQSKRHVGEGHTDGRYAGPAACRQDTGPDLLIRAVIDFWRGMS